MEIICPVKRTRWGELKSKADLAALIRTYGQPYGVDQSGPACNYNSSYPCDVSLYSYMGWGLHKGIDIPLNDNEVIFAAADWECIRTSETISQGLGIVLRHQEINLETLYWHNSFNLILVGQKGKKGDKIALAGSTGLSTSTHLHFETHNIDSIGNFVNYVDPLPLISFENDKMNNLVMVEGQKDIWLVVDNKRSLVYNLLAFQLLRGNIDQVQKLTEVQLQAIPDSGIVLAGLPQE